MNKQQAIEELKENSWEYENRYFKYELAVSLEDAQEIVSQIDEPKKIKIPQFVAKWIEYCRSVGHDFLRAISAGNAQANKVDCWIYSNQDTFARAWLDGYEVEQEKKYRVMLSNKQVLSKDDEFNTVFFVHDTTDLRAEFTRPELEQAGFGWVFDCEGIKVEEVK